MEPSSAGAPLDALEAAELSNLVSIWNLEAKEESPTARQKLIETFAERLERSGLLSAEPVHDKQKSQPLTAREPAAQPCWKPCRLAQRARLPAA